MNDEVKEILRDFLAESSEMLEFLEQQFVHLETDPTNAELLNEIFRCLHSMKGSAGFLGFSNLVAVVHHGESLLNKMRKGELTASTEIILVILDAIKVIKSLQDDIRDTGKDSHVDTNPIVNKLIFTMERAGDFAELSATAGSAIIPSVLTGVGSTSEPQALSADLGAPQVSPTTPVISETPVPMASTTAAETMPTVRNAGVISQEVPEATVSAADPVIPCPEAPAPSPSSVITPPIYEGVTPVPISPTEVKADAFTESHAGPIPALVQATPSFTDRQNKTQENTSPTTQTVTKGRHFTPQRTPDDDDSVGREARWLDHVLNLVGELVLGRNRLMTLGSELEEQYENNEVVRELGLTLAQFNLISSDLQQAVMKARMVPIRIVFAKVLPLIPDLATELGKQVRLELSGEETEVDNSVAEELGDLLAHLVRYSIDQSIEVIRERQTSGKHPEGHIRIAAFQADNHVVIRIEDDGRGLEPTNLKAKALSKGLVTPSELAGIEDRDAMNLIFLRGCNKAEQIPGLSEGVGRDVVRTNIERMNGRIELDSLSGKGCLITIKLPCAVPTIQVLLVEVQNSTFAVPLASVLETVKISKDDIKTINGRLVLNTREHILPLLRLADEFGIQSVDAEESYVVVVAVGEWRLGIVVDRLRAQEKVVIKSLGGFLEGISGVAGAMITGDGTVVLIVNLADMVQKIGTLNVSPMSNSNLNEVTRVVSFTTGAEEYAVHMREVQEIIQMAAITAVPNAPHYLEGVINLRGNVIPIINLPLRLGLVPSEQTKESRIIVIDFCCLVIGLIVDSVSEVLRIPTCFLEPPPSGKVGSAEYYNGVSRVEGRLLKFLDLAKLLGK